MADIMLTLSTNPDLRAPSIEEEARWLKNRRALYYPLHIKPARPVEGSWVYFVRNGTVVGRAKAKRVVCWDKENGEVTYTGVELGNPGWRVQIAPPMEIARRRLPHDGFQGFRYVTSQEQKRFEGAFKK